MSLTFRITQSDIIKHYGNVNFCQLFNKKLIVPIKFHIKIYRLNNNSRNIITATTIKLIRLKSIHQKTKKLKN